ncbi:neutral zinc metallopeptidase, partial [Pseudomonas aeruginosa]
MLWRKGRRSDNVIDARGEGGAGGGGGGMRIGGKGLSLGGVAIVVVVGLLMGQDPMQILGSLLGQMDSPAPATQQQAGGRAPAANDEQSEFVRSILGDTEDTWEQ